MDSRLVENRMPTADTKMPAFRLDKEQREAVPPTSGSRSPGVAVQKPGDATRGRAVRNAWMPWLPFSRRGQQFLGRTLQLISACREKDHLITWSAGFTIPASGLGPFLPAQPFLRPEVMRKGFLLFSTGPHHLPERRPRTQVQQMTVYQTCASPCRRRRHCQLPDHAEEDRRLLSCSKLPG
jgi:hypothetical protein